jgi:hypothetical protein
MLGSRDREMFRTLKRLGIQQVQPDRNPASGRLELPEHRSRRPHRSHARPGSGHRPRRRVGLVLRRLLARPSAVFDCLQDSRTRRSTAKVTSASDGPKNARQVSPGPGPLATSPASLEEAAKSVPS